MKKTQLPAARLFFETLYERREKSGLSFEKFAKAAGVLGSHLRRGFDGDRQGVDFDTAVRIANNLGIDLGDLQKSLQ